MQDELQLKTFVWAKRILPRLLKRPNGCWEWPGAKWPNGKYGNYGVIFITIDGWKRGHRIHRLALQVKEQSLLVGLCACHTCDNMICCNPDHLFAGTVADNNRDCDAKGRRGVLGRRSRPHNISKLDVLEIRKRLSLGQSQNSIASAFRVSARAIGGIKANVTYKNVK